MTLYRGLLTLALLATAAWAQDDRAYELKYRPEPGRRPLPAHRPWQWVHQQAAHERQEFNGRMHLLRRSSLGGWSRGRRQRLTLWMPSSGSAHGAHLQPPGEHLTVRRGEDALASELIHRPPTASVSRATSSASSPPALVRSLPRSGEADRADVDPSVRSAPPDVGQPSAPDTIFPRRRT